MPATGGPKPPKYNKITHDDSKTFSSTKAAGIQNNQEIPNAIIKNNQVDLGLIFFIEFLAFFSGYLTAHATAGWRDVVSLTKRKNLKPR